ncbi:hypothetical protein ACFQGE_10165 [Halomicroarcula sp. GCM10025817]|uniref:hypothetical protein n=1 Tax=Haloarcula TaxID=2237 RepID=UPI0023E7D16E|nr:hypothetical protein [Halomicroarcula sp. SYNS111]
MFGFFSSDTEEDDEEEDPETLPIQVTKMKQEQLVEETNNWIKRLNRKGDWSVYLLPEDPTLDQLNTVDDDLDRLYSKISSNRPDDREERMLVLNARQSLQVLLEMYDVYDSITKPVETSSNENRDNNNGSTAKV